MIVIKLLKAGLPRVMDGEIGMTFIVDKMTGTVGKAVVHVRDYRFNGDNFKYCIWSIPAEGYDFINE